MILITGIANTAPVAPAILIPINKDSITKIGFILKAFPITFGPKTLNMNCSTKNINPTIIIYITNLKNFYVQNPCFFLENNTIFALTSKSINNKKPNTTSISKS